MWGRVLQEGAPQKPTNLSEFSCHAEYVLMTFTQSPAPGTWTLKAKKVWFLPTGCPILEGDLQSRTWCQPSASSTKHKLLTGNAWPSAASSSQRALPICYSNEGMMGMWQVRMNEWCGWVFLRCSHRASTPFHEQIPHYPVVQKASVGAEREGKTAAPSSPLGK